MQLQDAQWLLDSLVVVIVGGMARCRRRSRVAARRDRLHVLVLVTADQRRRLLTQYSIVFMFVVLALVLAFGRRASSGERVTKSSRSGWPSWRSASE